MSSERGRDDGGAGTPRPAPGSGKRAGVATVERESGRASREAPAASGTARSGAAPKRGAGAGAGPEAAPGGRAVDASRSGPLRGMRERAWWRKFVGAVAVLGLVGTAVFGHAWAVERDSAQQQAAVRSVASGFVEALTNFDAKTVDSDFTRVQSYATGSFSTQAKQFFGSAIRSQLETALASSRGQVRDLYVQSVSGGQATVFAVVDQTYVNAKMTSPAADVLRMVLDLALRPDGWKVSDVTVLGSGSATQPGSSPNGSAPSGG